MPHRRRAHLPTHLRQRCSQLRLALAGPPQRRCWIPAGHRLDEQFKRFSDARLRLLGAGTPGPRTPNKISSLNPELDLATTAADRRASESGRRRYESIAAVAERNRFSGPPKSPPALIEERRNHSVLGDELGFGLLVALHFEIRSQAHKDVNINNVGFLSVVGDRQVR